MNFDKTYLLALDHRVQEARERVMGVALPSPEVVAAFRGDSLPPPRWWKAGNGAWGCLQTHLHALHLFWNSGAESALFLEDDVIFVDGFDRKLRRFLEHVPADWGQLYLGGQYRGFEHTINEWVLRPTRVNRTHAYAVRREYVPAILQHLAEWPLYVKDGRHFHIDHQLELAHNRQLWPVYSPSWWLCGQGEGQSMVNGRLQWERWWHSHVYAKFLPFIVCPGNFPDHDLLHFGFACEGTLDLVLDARIDDDVAFIARLKEIQGEALDHGLLPAISNPRITEKFLARFSTVRAFAYCKLTVEQLSMYPQNGLIPNPYDRKTAASRRSSTTGSRNASRVHARVLSRETASGAA